MINSPEMRTTPTYNFTQSLATHCRRPTWFPNPEKPQELLSTASSKMKPDELLKGPQTISVDGWQTMIVQAKTTQEFCRVLARGMPYGGFKTSHYGRFKYQPRLGLGLERSRPSH